MYIQLILPDTPDIVLIGVALGGGKVVYAESRIQIGVADEKVYGLLLGQHTLLLRLVRGGRTEDLALPVWGFNEAAERLYGAYRSLEARDWQRVFDATQGR